MISLKDGVKGVSWMTALTVLTKAIAVLKIAVLARILTPAQFGTYGIALLVLGLLEVLTETGINIFLIQQKDNTEKYLNSAWVVSVFRGFLIAFVIIVAGPFVTEFFGTQSLSNLFYLVALVAVLRGFINPMVVVYQKQLEFRKVFLFRGGLYLTDAVVSILLAFATKSESSMIIGMAIAAGVEIILSFKIFKEKPKFVFEKEKFLEVFNSGKWITGAGVFSYLFQNLDNIVVGKMLGTSNLGFYQQSYSISTLPVSGVSEIFNKVFFPVFVKMNDDTKKLRKTFFNSLAVIFILVSMFGILLVVFTQPIVRIFLGSNWLSIAPTLKVLAFFGVIKAILNSSYSLFLSLKLQKIVMLSELSGITAMAIVIIPLVSRFGTVGAGYAAIIAVLSSLPVVMFNLNKVFNKNK